MLACRVHANLISGIGHSCLQTFSSCTPISFQALDTHVYRLLVPSNPKSMQHAASECPINSGIPDCCAPDFITPAIVKTYACKLSV